MWTSLYNSTQKTIEFLSGTENDFNNAKIKRTMPRCTFNDLAIGPAVDLDDNCVLLDVGGGNGYRTSRDAGTMSRAKTYVIDPEAEKGHGVDVAVKGGFDKNLDFLEEQDRNKFLGFVSLRTPLSVAYDVVETAIENKKSFFVALEPLFVGDEKRFPASKMLKNNDYAKSLSFNPDYFLADGPKYTQKMAAFKQLIALDLANLLAENNFGVDLFLLDALPYTMFERETTGVFGAADSYNLTQGPDSAYYLWARK